MSRTILIIQLIATMLDEHFYVR